MNEDQLRRLLHQSAVPALDDEVRAAAALHAGRRTVTRRRRSGALAAALALGAAAGVLALPAAERTTSTVVLGCAPGVGTGGTGEVTGSADGVTLPVRNPTDEVLPVSGGGTVALAVPGTSSVTLPLQPGTSTVRCGGGAPLRLRVSGPEGCFSVGTAGTATVQRGGLVELTREQLGALPEGAVVDAQDGDEARRRVQVRAGGRVVAEAVWHAMPTDASWQLESVSRCA